MADEKDEKKEGEEKAPPAPDAPLKKIYILSIVSMVLGLVVLAVTVVLFLKSQATAKILEQSALAHSIAKIEGKVAVGEEGEEEGGEEEEEEKVKEAVEEEEAEQYVSLVYIPIEPSFTVNIMSDTRPRIMQVKVQLVIQKSELTETVKNNMPLIQNALVELFSSKRYEDLLTSEGRSGLRLDSVEVVKGLMKKNLGKPIVYDVLFTSFMIQ
jgi:flagellar protein FliL